ncbi:lysostaphin resistance A-like protein [Nitrospira sp. T9]|uniref:CPBP family intramembrane glutamic endopeptidase n=1 Tax=unclassified Nitrospira TaxID=2652172 RepID=UPI003F9970CA
MRPPILSSVDTTSQASTLLNPWWGAWSALLILGCFYVVQTLGIFMVSVVGGAVVGLAEGIGIGPRLGTLSPYREIWVLPLSLCVGTMGAIVVSIQVATNRATPSMDAVWFWELLGKSCNFRSLWWCSLLGLGLALGFVTCTEFGVLPSDDLPQPLFDAMISAPLPLQVGWALMFIGLFPVVEEVLFRGFLFTGLSQSWGPSVAGLMTTVLFVAVHMPKVLEYWPALLAISLIGALTVLLRIRTGILAPGIALHSTYNGVLVTAAFFVQPPS